MKRAPRRSPPRAFFLTLALALAIAAGPAVSGAARAEELVLGLSDETILVDHRFTGAPLLIFGAANQKGDLVIALRGPEGPLTVRRKERIAGIWINADSLGFDSVPRFYGLAATRPLEEIASPEALRRARIGIDNLVFIPRDAADPDKADEFRAALITLERESGHYEFSPEPVQFLADRLFRVVFSLPATVPIGDYAVDAYLFVDGRIVARASKPFAVRQAGFGTAIYRFAHEQPYVYGFLAIAIALVAGWLGGFVFRNRIRR